MKKLLLTALTGITILALTGCSRGSETAEPFEQGNTGYQYGPIMETENAYYYNTTDGFTYELHYYDKASGKNIFLCNKPECSHDGNEFCAATAGGRYFVFCTFYGDGIYIAAMEPEDNRIDYKLFKVSLDGTQLEHICTYFHRTDMGIYKSFSDKTYMAIYNGKAFIPCERMLEDGYQSNGTAIVDLDTGSVTYLEECHSNVSTGQQNYIPYGDYLYYEISNTYGNASRLYRYHLSKKTTEELPIDKLFTDYCIIGGKIVYTRQDEDDFCHIYSMDIESGEIVDMTGALADENGETLINKTGGQIFYEGEYMLITARAFSSSENGKCYIFNTEGQLLGKFTNPSHEYQTLGYDLCFLDGTVYIQDNRNTFCCSIQDILNDTPEWELLYSIQYDEEQ